MPLDEIIIEKMRSLMQRTMPRDLYDIFYLFEIENNDIEQYLFNFEKKAEFKKLNPGNQLRQYRTRKRDSKDSGKKI